MRITLNLDDDVLAAAQAEALRQRKPLGKVVSLLLRKAFETPDSVQIRAERNGIPLFPVREGARPLTQEIIRELLGETG